MNKTISGTWADTAIFYHIYPLGMLDAEKEQTNITTSRLPALKDWLTHWHNMGITAIYLGPVFKSRTHGYDTSDYYAVDPRLGTNHDLSDFCETCHSNGIRVILDTVFNHSGRDFFAFKDLQQHGFNSRYKRWYADINFHANSPFNDGFSYPGWNGHLELPKFNLENNELRSYLYDVVRFWKSEFNIDGLRLDAADVMDKNFLSELAAVCTKEFSDVWLMGEVIHGDYSEWANPHRLHSVTNYEAYKGLYSSLNDGNYFELAWTLNRQFGNEGLYKNIQLYNFCDNHDVNRIASQLETKAHLHPLHIALFTMPGIPSVYYGSEMAIEGKRDEMSDDALRPGITYSPDFTDNDLFKTIKNLIRIRKELPALVYGAYKEIAVANRQFVFSRYEGNSELIIALNSDNIPSEAAVPDIHGHFFDHLNQEDLNLNGTIPLYPSWGRILQRID